MTKLINLYRAMPSMANRAKLAAYMQKHPMAVVLATQSELAFLKVHGFID